MALVHCKCRKCQAVIKPKKWFSGIISVYNLQVIVDMNVAVLAHLLQDTENFAKSIQEACQRHLDERTQTAEAMDLLRLYHTARQTSPYVEDTGPKRQKHAHTWYTAYLWYKAVPWNFHYTDYRYIVLSVDIMYELTFGENWGVFFMDEKEMPKYNCQNFNEIQSCIIADCWYQWNISLCQIHLQASKVTSLYTY